MSSRRRSWPPRLNMSRWRGRVPRESLHPCIVEDADPLNGHHRVMTITVNARISIGVPFGGFLALLGGCGCCLLAGRRIRQGGQYLVPPLFGEHVAGAGADALGVVGVEIEDAYYAIPAGGVQTAMRIERDPCP
jgi:hypothetical protein